MSEEDIIHEIIAQRGKTHGDWKKQAELSQRLKTVLFGDGYTSGKLTPQMEEGVEMILIKLSRIFSGDPSTVDHWMDIAGYATLVHDTIWSEIVRKIEEEEEETPRPPIPKVVS